MLTLIASGHLLVSRDCFEMNRLFPCPVIKIPKVHCFKCSALKKCRKRSCDPDTSPEVRSGDCCTSESSSEKKVCGKLFREYCENSTIHGVKYVGETNGHPLDRVWWILSLLISIVLCSYLIRNLWIKWEETPVIVHLSERPTSVWEIPFPAVTICPETKARKEKFDYTSAYVRVATADNNGTEHNVTAAE